MIDRMGRKRALLGLTAVAVGALTILAPATAFAQDLGGQDLTGTSVPDLTGTVDSTTDTVTSGGGGTTDTVTQPIKDTVDSTTGTVDTTGGTVTQPVKDTVDKVDDVAPVSDTTKTVEDTTKSTTDSVTGAVSGTKDTTDSLGGTVLNPDLTINSPLKDKNGNGKISKKERIAATQERNAKIKAALAAERSEKVAARAKDASLAKLERNRRTQGAAPVAAFAPPPRETFLTQLADAAVEATKKLAFPLGLALMVGAFLMVQGRIDRKDAKLALAPIDSEQDLLSFQ